MHDPQTAFDPETGGKVAGWLWERREDIAKSLARLYRWFRGAKKEAPDETKADQANTEPVGSILLIGSGGVGKTTLAKLLAGEFDLLVNPPGEYVESIQTENFALPEKDDEHRLAARIVVPPGQEHRRPTEWAHLYRDLSAGRFRGVVFINCYGYHSLGKIRYKDHTLYATNRGRNKFLAAFLANRRAEELKVMELLKPHLLANTHKMWVVTLVVKQDLWWDDAKDVIQHYEQGVWAQAIAALQAQRNPAHFRHEFCFASLVINNYKTGLGDLLQRNVAGYDHQDYVSSLRRLFEVLDSLRQWENNDA